MANENCNTISIAFRHILLLGIAILCFNAKSKPKILPNRALIFTRAQSLNNGISVSWLEQVWNKNVLDTSEINPADLRLLKKLGFKSIRLPVAFAYYESHQIPIEKVLAHVDYVVKECNQYGFKLIIDYHGGNLNDSNYLTETPKIINLWSVLAKRYINQNPNNLFFELYNEPPHMNPQIWKDAAYNIVTAIREIDKQRTLIVGASNYNSIYELSRFVRLADENIIYTFHFYEPFLFTHQGAEWVGAAAATTGVSFPYNGENFPKISPETVGSWGEANYKQYPRDGNEQSLRDKLQIAKNWGNKYDVPILCGEYGVYNKYADLDSRCRYIKAVHSALKGLNIPGMLWEYNAGFSIFTGPPSVENLPACMQDAIGYTTTK
jgi:endoglucanase